MATERKHKRKDDRKNGRFLRLYGIASALIILAAIVAGSLVFFRAHTFEVEGNQRYTAEELLEKADIAEGENMFRIPRRQIAERMEAELPYLKSVKINLWPPEKVVIKVEETKPAATVEDGGTLWYVDSDGKLLERVTASGGYPRVSGLTLLAPAEGTKLAVADTDSLKVKGLLGLLSALEERNLIRKVADIDLSAGSYVTMSYNGQLTLKMNLTDDFNYDLKMLAAAEDQYISENWGEGDHGTLDMTKSAGEAVLSRN